MFKLSPNQFHAMNERQRVRAGLAGFAGFADGVDVATPEGAVLDTQPRPTELLDGTFGPNVGAGLGQRRPRLALSRDQLDFADHSIVNLPHYTRLPGSNIRPGAPGVLSGFRGAFAGLGRLGFELTQMPAQGGLTQPSTTTSGGTITPRTLLTKDSDVAYATEQLAKEAQARLAAQMKTNLAMHLAALTEYRDAVAKSAEVRLADMNAMQSGGPITVADVAQVQKNLTTAVTVANDFLSKAQASFSAMEQYGATPELAKARDLVAAISGFAQQLTTWSQQAAGLKATPVPGSPITATVLPDGTYEKPSSGNTGLIVAGVAVVAVVAAVVIWKS